MVGFKCIENKCVCPHGLASRGSVRDNTGTVKCTADGILSCHSCKFGHTGNTCQACLEGFYLDPSGTCQPNVCSCPNGQARTWESADKCSSNGAVECVTCKYGYVLKDDHTCSNETCPSGFEKLDGKCVDYTIFAAA